MRVAIVGTGNIGTDLLEKLRRSEVLEVALFAGVDPNSPGLARARAYGIPTSTAGVDAVFELDDPVDIVFEATSAAVHRQSAPRYEDAGLRAIDLTPAKVGKVVVPSVNMDQAEDALNLNLASCGGQATVPIVAAVRAVTPVAYAEIVSTIASLSAGPGTRQNIDEFTRTTARALESVGGALRGKAIIILNPADPPILMRNSIFCIVAAAVDRKAVSLSIGEMAARVVQYVPGYRIVAGPEYDELADDELKVSISIEVTGGGDFLPPYAGNLDIMTAAATAVGEQIAAPRGMNPA